MSRAADLVVQTADCLVALMECRRVVRSVPTKAERKAAQMVHCWVVCWVDCLAGSTVA